MNSSAFNLAERAVLILILMIVVLSLYSKLVPKVQESLEKAAKGEVTQSLTTRRER